MGLLQPHGRHRRGDGEIAVSLVSRTRCSALRAAPQRRDPCTPGLMQPWVPVLHGGTIARRRRALTRLRRRSAPRTRELPKRPPMTKIFRTLDDVDVKG